MMFLSNKRVRLTHGELNRLRQANAHNGHCVNRVDNRDELLHAIIEGLPATTQRELCAFLDAPASSTCAAAHQASTATPPTT